MIQTTASRTVNSPNDTAGRPTICHVIHALGVGGAEVLVDQMMRRMNDRYRCVVAVLDEVGEIGQRLQADGFVVQHLHRQPGIDRGCARRLDAFARRENARLLHAHQYTPFFQAMMSRGLTGNRPVLFTEHGRHFPDLPSRKRMMANRMLLRKCDRLVGCGKAVRNALVNNEGLPADRVKVVYNGADLDALNQPSPDARRRIRAEFGIADDCFVAVQVARLHELKDHGTALRAIHEVRKSVPGIRLLIAGDGDRRGMIEAMITDLQLEDHVILAGARGDVADLLAASDAFLMSSISEGIPLTIIEAMAARIPVVATAVGGIPEMIDDNCSGLLAPSGDDRSLAKCLQRLHADPALRKSMTEHAELTARSTFSLSGMLSSYSSLYSEMLAGTGVGKTGN
ncbi:MAG: glycosyltransferase [Planctomycetaceae bacterium]|nr:glycosyltransferase [Planctomycetaceae bacterium]